MRSLFETMLTDAGIAVKKLPEGVEYHKRQGEDRAYEFYLNHSQEEAVIENVTGINLLTGEKINGTLSVAAYDVAVVCTKQL